MKRHLQILVTVLLWLIVYSARAQQVYNVEWLDPVGSTISTDGLTVTKTAGNAWNNCGAVGRYYLAANTDGWIEYTVNSTTERKAVGFVDYNQNDTYYTTDYALYLGGDAKFYAAMNGSLVANVAVSVGDVLRLERVGSTMYFKKNGTSIHTETGAMTMRLIPDAAIYTSGATLSGMHASFGRQTYPVIEWTSVTGVSIDKNSLTRSRAGAGYTNCGAFSVSKLNAGTDGWVEMTVAELDKTHVMGLSQTNSTTNDLDIDFAISIGSDNINIYEDGSNVKYVGKCVLGTVVRVSREGTQVKYYVDGVLKHTSTKSSSTDLYVDVGFYNLYGTVANVQLSFGGDNGTVPDHNEFLALKTLYDNNNGVNWQEKDNWPQTWPSTATVETMSTWYGITVTGGDITTIRLNDNGLQGQLPPALTNLTALDTLELMINQLSGPIPANIGDLVQLKYLNLLNNELSGSIPSSIGNLVSLRQCILGGNALIGELPATMEALDSLTYLDLAYNQLSSLGSVNFDSLDALTDMPLQGNVLDFSSIETLPLQFSSGIWPQQPIPAQAVTAYIQEPMVLTSRPLGPQTTIVWEKQATDTTWVDITTADEDTVGATYTRQTVSEDLVGTYRWLMTSTAAPGEQVISEPFEVSVSSLYDPGIHYPFKDLYDSLNGAYWTNKQGWPTPGNWPSAQPALTELATWSGIIADEDFVYAVELFGNNLTGTIPASFWETNIQYYVRMNGNHIKGLAPADFDAPPLYELDLTDNEIAAFPSNFGEFYNLQNLYLGNNKLARLPASFGYLANLTNLSLGNNNLVALPESFPDLYYLSSLDLSFNKLTELPADFGDMNMLWNIDLADNELTSLPEFVNVPFHLDVSNNRLDFGTLEELDNLSITSLTLGPQKEIIDIKEVVVKLGQPFSIPSRDPGANSTITWKKLINGVWTSVNTLNQDASQETFTRNAAQESDLGQYRWSMTNSQVTGFVIQSGAITVKDARKVLLAELAFRYQYDDRRRMTHKKVPGADWVYMVYDNRDRLVMTQDGNQRAKTVKEWTFTKYDALNRPVLTGIYKDASANDQAAMQAQVNAFYEAIGSQGNTSEWYETLGTAVHHYTNNSFPNVSAADDYLTATYYDDYTFRDNIPGQNLNYDATQLSVPDGTYKAQDAAAFTRVIGQVTGTKVKNLETNDWYYTVNYYDNRYRVIQSIMQNHKGGIDKVTNVYDFVGKVMRTKTSHTLSTGPATTITRKFEYDHAGRLMKTWHKVNSDTYVLLSTNEYNEIGQLITKKLHSEDAGTTGKQEVDYTYNIRGWLTKVNDPQTPGSRLFSMELKYNNPTANGGTAQYNGNISEMIWQTAGITKQSYGYYYDTLNRLKEARYFDLVNTDNNNRYNEIIGGIGQKGYDLNGNILNLTRRGRIEEGYYGLMDNLTYTYNGNQLTRVDDAITMTTTESGFKELTQQADEYTYDPNGSMVEDKNKDIAAIEYNFLNLPRTVTKTNGDQITYAYDATGRKLYQTVTGTQNKTSDYLGEFFYENDTLKFINHEEGRVVPPPAGQGVGNEYQYHLKDHLGNIRLTFTAKQEADSVTATLETANVTAEQGEFLYYDEAVKINSTLFDHTNAGSTYYAARLNGSTNEQYGLAKSLSVMPGDTVRAEVYAKYLDPENNNWTQALTDVISAIAGGTAPAGTFVDGGATGSTGGALPSFTSLLNKSGESGTAPKAYLNYLIFDREYNLLNGGFVRMTEAAEEAGQDVAHEKLTTEFVVTEPGYVYIYISNDNAALGGAQIETYWDDFSVEHVKSPVVQEDDYYPFGLTFNSYSREDNTPNFYQYNGNELQDELDLGWYDYGARMYQPDLGRFFTTDRFTEKYFSETPYHYVFNNPLLFIDSNGDSTIYYNNAGEVLHISHDGLENSAVVIADENLEVFGKWKNLVTENISDEAQQSNILRKFGDNYMLGEFESFYDSNSNDTQGENGEPNPNGLINEHGSFLYEENGQVRLGDENIEGTPRSVYFKDENLKENPVGRVHTHPNVGKRNEENTGTYVEGVDHGSADGLHSNPKNFRNVIITGTKIYLYTKGKADIVVNRSNTFKR